MLWSLAGRSPWLLYPLTALFGASPTTAQVRSFDDPVTPEAERSMLARGSSFAAFFGRLLEECGQRGAWYLASATRIGWGRDPGFTLDDVDRGGTEIFVSTGELDNVHLPAIARFLAERVRAAHLELIPNQGRFGVMGPGLEAGLSRFLDAE